MLVLIVRQHLGFLSLSSENENSAKILVLTVIWRRKDSYERRILVFTFPQVELVAIVLLLMGPNHSFQLIPLEESLQGTQAEIDRDAAFPILKLLVHLTEPSLHWVSPK